MPDLDRIVKFVESVSKDLNRNQLIAHRAYVDALLAAEPVEKHMGVDVEPTQHRELLIIVVECVRVADVELQSVLDSIPGELDSVGFGNGEYWLENAGVFTDMRLAKRAWHAMQL